jgi:hypothetical protein
VNLIDRLAAISEIKDRTRSSTRVSAIHACLSGDGLADLVLPVKLLAFLYRYDSYVQAINIYFVFGTLLIYSMSADKATTDI